MRYLLDTNVLSEPLMPVPNEGVLRRLRDHRDEITTASVVWHDMLFGCCRLPPSLHRAAIEGYLNDVVLPSIPILSHDVRAARWHAEERAELTGIGRTPPFADGQTAAIARTNDLAVVTSNVADYAGFHDVRAEGWRG